MSDDMTDEEYYEMMRVQVEAIATELRKICIEHQVNGALPEAIFAALLQGMAITGVMLAQMRNPGGTRDECEDFLVNAVCDYCDQAWDASTELLAHFVEESDTRH